MENTLCSWVRKLNTVNMSVLSLYRFNANHQNPSTLLCRYQQTDHKVYMRDKDPGKPTQYQTVNTNENENE